MANNQVCYYMYMKYNYMQANIFLQLLPIQFIILWFQYN